MVGSWRCSSCSNNCQRVHRPDWLLQRGWTEILEDNWSYLSLFLKSGPRCSPAWTVWWSQADLMFPCFLMQVRQSFCKLFNSLINIKYVNISGSLMIILSTFKQPLLTYLRLLQSKLCLLHNGNGGQRCRRLLSNLGNLPWDGDARSYNHWRAGISHKVDCVLFLVWLIPLKWRFYKERVNFRTSFCFHLKIMRAPKKLFCFTEEQERCIGII